MTETDSKELQRDLEQTLLKLKAETEPEQRRFFLREMSRLLPEADCSPKHKIDTTGR